MMRSTRPMGLVASVRGPAGAAATDAALGVEQELAARGDRVALLQTLEHHVLPVERGAGGDGPGLEAALAPGDEHDLPFARVDDRVARDGEAFAGARGER